MWVYLWSYEIDFESMGMMPINGPQVILGITSQFICDNLWLYSDQRCLQSLDAKLACHWYFYGSVGIKFE
jgi:hypothetical protein